MLLTHHATHAPHHSRITIWQAAVPFDSRQTPPPPPSWDAAGGGGITLRNNGTVRAYTGAQNASSGSNGGAPLVLRWSLLVTPTRPVDLPKHFKERYAQLSGPSNYSFLAANGATVVNMHQGNGINPWINYPYKTKSLMADASTSSPFDLPPLNTHST